MWFRVAALLGGRTVEEWQEAMTGAEFVDWCAFYALEPWGFDISNWRMGVLGAVTANYSGRSKKRLKPSDFYPKTRGRRRGALTPMQFLDHLKKEHADDNGDS